MRRSMVARVAALTALVALAACTSNAPATGSNTPSVSGSPVPTNPGPTVSPATHPATSGPRPTTDPAPSSDPAPSRASSGLPLALKTGSAKQVLTVVAASGTATTATLQAWSRTNDGWARVGPSVPAHLGAAGLGRAREGSTRTPAGSFTLTAAFGRDANPGTALPYTRTTPADWWISEPGPSYNTRQRCTLDCGFTQGVPNEHLYDEIPYYELALVIDYNTPNAPGGVRAGAGSAFFVHVTDGGPTEGCVSIPKDRLAAILRWLRPSDHPRILLGVA